MTKIDFSRYSIFLTLLFFVLMPGCYEPKEGCLDYRATNFDVEADEPCDACCQFSQFNLSILSRLTKSDTFSVFQLNTRYPTSPEMLNFFRIADLRFYLSNFCFVGSNGQEYSISDSIAFKYLGLAGDTISAHHKDHFAYFDRNEISDFKIGTFKSTGSFSKIKFDLGLAAPISEALPGSFPASHALSFKNDSTNWSQAEGYYFNWIGFFRDTFASTPKSVIKITKPDLIKIELAHDFELREGSDIQFVLRINFLEWFTGVNWEADDFSIIKQKIQANLKDSFQVVSVEQP